mgnify:FL=1
MQQLRSHRDHLRAHVGVTDTATGARLGHLLDLTPEGLGVSGRYPEPEAWIRRLRLDLPVRIRQHRALELGVDFRWLGHVPGGRWHAGFRITSVADEDLEILEQLMTWYAEP